MYSTMRRAATVAAVTTAGLTAVMTSSAAAFSELDEVLVDTVGYDVAGDGFTNGVPDAPAVVEWTHSGTFGTFPRLDGKIHFDGATKCARVLFISLDSDGDELGRTTSDTECPATTGHHARNIEVGGVGPIDGEPGASEVIVRLQTQNPDLTFTNAGSQTVAFGPELDTDSVQILRREFDLGSGPFSGGAPDGSATVRWVAEEGSNRIQALLTGTLYADNADDQCVWMRARYKDADGDILDTRDGTERCLTSDDPHEFPINMGGAYSNYALRQVTYAIIKRGGDGVETQAGAATVELGDGLVANPNPGPFLP